MKVDKYKVKEVFTAEDGDRLTVDYSNRGEPYREGVSFSLDTVDQKYISLFLEGFEVCQLRDLLLKLYPLE